MMAAAVEPPVEEDFRALLASVLKQPVRSVNVAKRASRAYSNIWMLDVETATDRFGVVAKYCRDGVLFKKQIRFIQAARAAYAGRDDVCIPYLGSCEQSQLLLMQRVRDPTVQSLCHFSFSRPFRTCTFQHWQRTLQQACVQTGRWLREWHESTAEVGPLAPAFETYLSNREDCLSLLEHDDRRRLLALIQSLGSETLCVTHGDFTPQNVLWSPERLTVIDFGVGEWERMTPWWDYIWMERSIVSAMRFAVKSPGWWMPSASRTATQAFSDGYGKSAGSARARLACLAVHHLVLHGSDTRRNARSYRKRAQWHKRELQRTLALAEEAAD
ncbi:MAG TPA: phosphotransferase [Gammaproteobacteria bacterium]|nr:phosphotransferase [Gammaproteobacteria bacterium]